MLAEAIERALTLRVLRAGELTELGVVPVELTI
jgi:hypothetical protein